MSLSQRLPYCSAIFVIYSSREQKKHFLFPLFLSIETSMLVSELSYFTRCSFKLFSDMVQPTECIWLCLPLTTSDVYLFVSNNVFIIGERKCKKLNNSASLKIFFRMIKHLNTPGVCVYIKSFMLYAPSTCLWWDDNSQLLGSVCSLLILPNRPCVPLIWSEISGKGNRSFRWKDTRSHQSYTITSSDPRHWRCDKEATWDSTYSHA